MNSETNSFDGMGLNRALLDIIRDKQFTRPTPIQAQTISHGVGGRDILGCAQTGTGKTAAFALPIIQRLGLRKPPHGHRPIRSLIVAPTRELAAQISQTVGEFGRPSGLRHTAIFGGVNQRPQCEALRRGVDILIATPGRLLDLIGQQRLRLDRVEILVLDEADRMLDMGFLPDIKRIVGLVPDERQTMLFSATMPQQIKQMSNQFLRDPVAVTIAPQAPAAETIAQAVYFVQQDGKLPLLKNILSGEGITKAIVFTRTKHRADRVAHQLEQASIAAAAMHSNKSQNQRQRTLDQLKSGRLRVLVASDIASRGIDVSDVSHVFNYDLPNEAQTYVHRIGRTGRAGLEGQAVSFCSNDERELLRDIEKLLGRRLEVAGGREEANRHVEKSFQPRSDVSGGQRRSSGGGRAMSSRPGPVKKVPRRRWRRQKQTV
ncbi:MAG: DEAD/DEAH box helicase [Planctomycetes bacterium]|nr:DEAD/DEAH box helicase [Planctomycetota bacterium]